MAAASAAAGKINAASSRRSVLEISPIPLLARLLEDVYGNECGEKYQFGRKTINSKQFNLHPTACEARLLPAETAPSFRTLRPKLWPNGEIRPTASAAIHLENLSCKLVYNTAVTTPLLTNQTNYRALLPSPLPEHAF